MQHSATLNCGYSAAVQRIHPTAEGRPRSATLGTLSTTLSPVAMCFTGNTAKCNTVHEHNPDTVTDVGTNKEADTAGGHRFREFGFTLPGTVPVSIELRACAV